MGWVPWARQPVLGPEKWERKRYVEELSAKLSLMAASSSEKGEILDPKIGPISDGNYLNNRCVYLEQLLNVRKDTKIGSEGGGNVYIEESSSSAATGGKT
ncbi:hypothetical protein Zmor_009550 [Zophobas morio]|uniref:Uncharacterized protein n=1 Tax=Zophobas morio TaxID=2755281 RepID=A0AA38IJ71_9CUCU|nr:hypothetical protein Zmor_009550 [Zophobas morio]